jgi:hypothetical protein
MMFLVIIGSSNEKPMLIAASTKANTTMPRCFCKYDKSMFILNQK